MTNRKIKISGISLNQTYDYPHWESKNLNQLSLDHRLHSFNQKFGVELDESMFLKVEAVFSLADRMVNENWHWLSRYWNSDCVRQVVSNYQQMCLNIMIDQPSK
jgi:acyl carrier protein phosphodiesterase